MAVIDYSPAVPAPFSRPTQYGLNESHEP